MSWSDKAESFFSHLIQGSSKLYKGQSFLNLQATTSNDLTTISNKSNPFFVSFFPRSQSTPAEIMNVEQSRNFRSSSWPKTVVRKWLNLKSDAEEFLSDHHSCNGVEARRRTSCSDEEDERVFPREKASGWQLESSPTASLDPTRHGPDPPEVKLMRGVNDEIRMFVGTWNVGGRSPNSGLDLSDWLMSSPAPADIFVLGFQEIVPLTASNVLGSEDLSPSAAWLALIRRALNPRPTAPPQPLAQNPRVSFSDLHRFTQNANSEDDEDDEDHREPSSRSAPDGGFGGSPETLSSTAGTGGEERYYLSASKQMVGIFLCVWLRSGLMRHVNSIKVSCIGRGILGFMGNKGSVSISMCLRRTAFCFVCTHLTSGEKDGDEIRRNSDVLEILKRTRFQNSSKFVRQSPETISEHDKIIWLGDLNYRLNSTGFCFDVHELLRRNEWQALLENDQLRIERNAGRVFAGWEEGSIFFPPTYKYLADSNIYAVNPLKRKDKRRTPAWCDRILWRGKGMKQMWYIRGESRFSDHRPVYSLFSINLDRAD